jgi:hypothetical protein
MIQGSRYDLIRHDVAAGLKLYEVERPVQAGDAQLPRYLFVGPPSLPTALPDGAIDRACAEGAFDAILADLRAAGWAAPQPTTSAIGLVRPRCPPNLVPLRRRAG